MNLDAFDPAHVEAALTDCGALSVTFTDAGDDPVLEPAPGEVPLWTDTRVTALFDAGSELENLTSLLESKLGVSVLPANHIEELADRQWEREWLKDFTPMQFGKRLWVIPGDATPPDPEAINLRLDPGLAFGTGTHSTTALCLEWLDRIDVTDLSLLDFGCGSGILSVAAARLGAGEVIAVDIDLQALSATRQNAERNGVSEKLRVSEHYNGSSGPHDIVVANILAGTLIDNVGFIHSVMKPRGQIALSGILTDQVDAVSETFRHQFMLDEPVYQQGWALLLGTRK